MKRKLSVFLLALCMLIPLLVACDDVGTEGTDSTASSDASGNKDTSEIVINTPAPAIAHAIYRATGTWHRELPITPEQIALSMTEE